MPDLLIQSIEDNFLWTKSPGEILGVNPVGVNQHGCGEQSKNRQGRENVYEMIGLTDFRFSRGIEIFQCPGFMSKINQPTDYFLFFFENQNQQCARRANFKLVLLNLKLHNWPKFHQKQLNRSRKLLTI